MCTSGVENDAVCDLKNHGGEHKAVYAFSIEHYSYWRESLKKPDLGPGSFGENLTLSSLNEAEVCIGDQLQMGSAVLEVSQPRVPCFKLGTAHEWMAAKSICSPADRLARKLYPERG